MSMGSAFILILSDIYVHYFEIKLFNNSFFLFHNRNVNDCSAFLNSNDLVLSDILSVINSFDEHIQFVSEFENNNWHNWIHTIHFTIHFTQLNSWYDFRKNNTFHTTFFREGFAVSLLTHQIRGPSSRFLNWNLTFN